MVDRVARHRLMMWCDVLRALVVGSVPLAWLLGLLTLPQLYVVVLATGVLTVFFDVAYQSYLPVLLDERSLVDGNGKLGITGSAAGMLGSTIAGGLVAAVGAAQAVLVNAFSYVVSAVSLLLIRTPEPKPEPPRGPRPTFRGQIGEGLRFVLTHPILNRIVACTGTVNLFVTMVLSMEMPFLVRVLHLAPETAGLLLALGASGVWCGSVWLTTEEAETDPVVRRKLLAATSRDTVRSRSWTGKPARLLRTAWTDAWESAESPGTLPMPLQFMLVSDALRRIHRSGSAELTTFPAGQIIGATNQVRPAREVVYAMVEEFVETMERLSRLTAGE